MGGARLFDDPPRGEFLGFGAEPVPVAAADFGQRVLGGVALFDPFGRVAQEGGQRGDDVRLELGVVALPHREGDEDHDRAHRHLEGAAAAGQRGGELAAAEHQRVEDDRRADRVGEDDGEAAGVEGLRGRGGEDAGEDRAGAGRVEDTEAEAEPDPGPEAVAALLHPDPAGEAGAEGLDPGGQRRDQEDEAEAGEDDDRDVPQQVVGKPERVDHVDQREEDEGEGEDQSGDDAERFAAAARRPRREHDRQHRHDAGRHRGRGAGDEAEDEE